MKNITLLIIILLVSYSCSDNKSDQSNINKLPINGEDTNVDISKIRKDIEKMITDAKFVPGSLGDVSKNIYISESGDEMFIEKIDNITYDVRDEYSNKLVYDDRGDVISFHTNYNLKDLTYLNDLKFDFSDFENYLLSFSAKKEEEIANGPVKVMQDVVEYLISPYANALKVSTLSLYKDLVDKLYRNIQNPGSWPSPFDYPANTEMKIQKDESNSCVSGNINKDNAVCLSKIRPKLQIEFKKNDDSRFYDHTKKLHFYKFLKNVDIAKEFQFDVNTNFSRFYQKIYSKKYQEGNLKDQNFVDTHVEILHKLKSIHTTPRLNLEKLITSEFEGTKFLQNLFQKKFYVLGGMFDPHENYNIEYLVTKLVEIKTKGRNLLLESELKDLISKTVDVKDVSNSMAEGQQKSLKTDLIKWTYDSCDMGSKRDGKYLIENMSCILRPFMPHKKIELDYYGNIEVSKIKRPMRYCVISVLEDIEAIDKSNLPGITKIENALYSITSRGDVIVKKKIVSLSDASPLHNLKLKGNKLGRVTLNAKQCYFITSRGGDVNFVKKAKSEQTLERINDDGSTTYYGDGNNRYIESDFYKSGAFLGFPLKLNAIKELHGELLKTKFIYLVPKDY